MSPAERAERCQALGYPVIENDLNKISVVLQHPSGAPVRMPWSTFTTTKLPRLLSRIDAIVEASA